MVSPGPSQCCNCVRLHQQALEQSALQGKYRMFAYPSSRPAIRVHVQMSEGYCSCGQVSRRLAELSSTRPAKPVLDIIIDGSVCADAEEIARFVKANLWDGQKQRLLRSFLSGPSDVEGFADDYAYLISGLLDLHSVTGGTEWLAFAQQLQQKQDELFWDDTAGGLSVRQVLRMSSVSSSCRACRSLMCMTLKTQ